jgi:hypothetical protein
MEEIEGFVPEEWLDNDSNIALIDPDTMDVALFERQHKTPHAVHGHYFFHSRGKEAVKAAKSALKEIFSGKYNVEIICGFTPLDNKGALWMNRHLGFTSHGNINTSAGPCDFVVLTRQEWENTHYE